MILSGTLPPDSHTLLCSDAALREIGADWKLVQVCSEHLYWLPTQAALRRPDEPLDSVNDVFVNGFCDARSMTM